MRCALFFRDFTVTTVWIYLACLGPALLVGCSSAPVLPPPPPPLDPPAATVAAMQMVDANKSSSLDRQEMAAYPSLLSALPRIDTDQDGTVTSVELQNRFNTYDQMAIGVLPFTCVIMGEKAPVEGVQAKLIPEPFMSTWLKPASGTSDATGQIIFKVDGATEPGVPRGLYRLELSGNNRLPPQFLAPTRMGVELMMDNREIESGMLIRLLK